jgi:uncharacterized protein (DUF924 family)/diadenosine tetraphosphate (Ap4A) HIT family hydrolase
LKDCVFCAGLRGEVELSRVFEDDQVLAFLDHKPVFPGHVLLIPKRHIVTLDELDPQEVPGLFEKLRVLSRAVPLAMGGQGCFVANNNVVSQSVPHLHWHAVPRTKGDGLKGFFWPRHPYRDAEAREETRARLEDVVQQELILDFWFGPGQGPSSDFYVKRWFTQDPEFDRALQERFGESMEAALAGGLTRWESTSRGQLALILLLDQFTRNLGRHRAAAFAGDERAQRLAREMVERKVDQTLTADQRVFVYLPFEHGESREWQELSLKMYEQLRDQAGEKYQNYLTYAEKHAVIIEKFGRYPHRNEALGRESTPEEKAFLAGPGSTFW